MKIKQVNVVFRLDDYSALSSTDMELKIIDVFRKNEASLTFGVIPFVCAGDIHNPSPQKLLPLPAEKGDILRAGFEEGVVDVALHGYSHQTINEKEHSEFAGLDYESQVERLSKGKQLLEVMIGAHVTTFVPPWNEYDRNTLRALEDLCLTTLSAGWKGVAIEESRIRFLPATCNLPRLRDAVETARTSSDEQPLIVVLFHLYDFKEMNEKLGNTSLQELSDLLNWLKSQKNIRLMSIRQAAQLIGDLSVNRFLTVERWRSLEVLAPSFLREKTPVLLYHEAGVLPRTLVKVCSFIGMILVLGCAIAFIVGFLILSISNVAMKTTIFGCALATAAVIVYAFHDIVLSPKRMVASAIVIGTSIGSCFQYLRKKGLRSRDRVGEKKIS